MKVAIPATNEERLSSLRSATVPPRIRATQAAYSTAGAIIETSRYAIGVA